MRETFLLQGHTFSINAMYGPKKFKTSAARDWELTVLHQLNSVVNREKFIRLRSYFDPAKHGYAVTIVAVYPTEKFYTKSGLVSAHTQDVSNVEKPLIDLLFLPKYSLLESPYGCQNLNIDDKYLTRLMSIKRAGERYEVHITIKIVKRD